MGTGLLIRLIAAGSFAAAPVALNSAPATPAIFTGDAVATGPGINGENTGGNVQGGVGRSESRVVIGDPQAAPVIPPIVTPSVAARPAQDAAARARALVDEARAKADAQIAEARARAEAAAEAARQQAEEAHARSMEQSEQSRARAEASHSSHSASAYTDDED
jgi:hypothetical protein